MKTQRYECDRPGCHQVSNGAPGAWWAVAIVDDEVRMCRILYADERYRWAHFCGAQHALAAVNEAMTVVQERT